MNAVAASAIGPWMTVSEAVAYLGFPSVRAVYQAVRRGQIPACRIGRRLRFLKSDLDGAVLRLRGMRT